MSKKIIVMIGSDPDSQGGIATVIKTYQQAGLFEKWPIRLLVTTTPEKSTLTKAWQAIHSIMRLFNLILKNQVALIHVHMAARASFWRKSLLLWLAYFTKTPAMLHLHTGKFLHFYQQKNPLIQWYIRKSFNHMDTIAVLSKHWETTILDITNHPNIVTLPNPIILPNLVNTPPKNISPNEKNTFLFVFLGALSPEKGLDDLLEAFGLLTQEQPNVKLICAGNGHTDTYLKKAKKLNIEHLVEFPGWIDADTKTNLLSHADCFILPSYYEGQPMSILEAMCQKLPVIATTVGGIPDLLDHDVEGLLIPPGDILALKTAMTKILHDPASASQMGEKGFEKVKNHFSTEKSLPPLEQVYRRFST